MAYFLFFLIFACFSSHAQINVSADFESGSLEKWELLDSRYRKINGTTVPAHSILFTPRSDPRNPVDDTIRPSAVWYYFRLEGVKDKFVSLRIKNNLTSRPFYSYNGQDFFRFDEDKNFAMIGKYFTEDSVYIAPFIPYTITRLHNKMQEWGANDFVSISEIGQSAEGRTLHMLTITDKSIDNDKKKSVWIHGRVHPSESPCSYHLESLIDLIASESELAKELRKQVVFYIVPIANPDGVFGGYSRSASNGVNIEINWHRPDSLTNPEIRVLKSTIDELSSAKPLTLMLNMHTQRDNRVSYFIHTAKSTSKKNLKKERLLASLTMDDDRLLYRPEDQKYFVDRNSRYVEGQIWERYRDTTLAITFETSYTFYIGNKNGQWVSLENLKSLAENSFFAICDYLNIENSQRVVIDNPAEANESFLKISEPDKIFFGDDYFVANKKGVELTYTFNNLKEGTYNIYRWQPGTNIERPNSRASGRWIKYGVHNQEGDGEFTYTIISASAREIFDAIQLRVDE
jgi:hypothetical protein